jgi:hypothetical protein
LLGGKQNASLPVVQLGYVIPFHERIGKQLSMRLSDKVTKLNAEEKSTYFDVSLTKRIRQSAQEFSFPCGLESVVCVASIGE